MNFQFFRPMLATLGQPPTRFTDFAVEAKYDRVKRDGVTGGYTVDTV